MFLLSVVSWNVIRMLNNELNYMKNLILQKVDKMLPQFDKMLPRFDKMLPSVNLLLFPITYVESNVIRYTKQNF